MPTPDSGRRAWRLDARRPDDGLRSGRRLYVLPIPPGFLLLPLLLRLLRRRRLLLLLLLLPPLLLLPLPLPDARPLAAQERGSELPDSLAAALARADSARAALVQPPGAYGGVRAMDVVRLPFQLLGSALVLGAYGVGALYWVVDRTLLDRALHLQAALEAAGVGVRAGTIGSGSWPALIVRYRGLDPFFVEAGYSLRQYQHYRTGLSVGDEALGGAVDGRYRRLRQPHFWGIGPDSRTEDRADYGQDLAEAGVSGWWRRGGGALSLSAGAAWEWSRVDRGWDGSRPDVQDVFGPDPLLFSLDRPTRYLRLEGGATLDRTRVEGLQERGARATGRWQYFEGTRGTPSSFHRLSGEARFLLPAGERRLLAVRLLAEEHLGERGRGVPFTHLAALGGGRGLRGFQGERFRDRALLAGQLEWRYEIQWMPAFPDYRLEAFVFADGGAVGASLGSMRGSDFRATPGLGLRLVRRGRALGEAYLSFGGDRRGALGAGRPF